MLQFWVALSCLFKVNCPLVGPGPIGRLPFLGVFLRDFSPYLRDCWRKPWNIPNGLVDKSDQGLNLAPPVYQLWAQNRFATDRDALLWNLLSNELSLKKLFLLSNKCVTYSSYRTIYSLYYFVIY